MSSVHRHRRMRRKVKGKMSGKTRFRALVRMVMYNRPWLVEARMSKGMDDDIKRNVRMIDLATRQKYESLSLANKSLLRKDARLRTDEDIETLFKVIGNLKCFRRYPENVRKELVATTYFEYYGPGRVIVKQNHVSTFLGFLLWGVLEVSLTRVDPVFNKLVTEVTSQLLPGSVFGDVSLLHSIPRTATVTSLTAVELLILKKDDFDRVLKASLQKQWDEISSALKQFPYFDSWGDVARRECCMLSDTASYSANDVILGRGQGKLPCAHFVLSGTCAMIQTLMVSRSGNKFKLHRSNSFPSPETIHPEQSKIIKVSKYPPTESIYHGKSTARGSLHQSGSQNLPKAEPLFMQVCLFNQGGCFNLGESLKQRTIVALSDVMMLRIPLYLLRQHSVANIWQRIRQMMESRLATEDQLFQKFLEDRRWDKYKKELCASMRNPRTVNPTTIHDVPYYWRVQDLEMCGVKPCPPAPR